MDTTPISPQLRTWLYGIATAIVPLLVAYGVIEDTEATLWVAVVAAVLGTGTALLHRPTKYPTAADDPIDGP